MNDEYIDELIQRDNAVEPVKEELGGDYYYKCKWITCNNTVNRWDKFCSQCGQRILWEDKNA